MGRLQSVILLIEPENNASPLFEVHLELQLAESVYRPPLGFGVQDGFVTLIDNLLSDVYNAAKFVPRLAKEKRSYNIELEENAELSAMKDEVISRVASVMKYAQDYQASFEKYSYLWIEDQAEFMQQFLLYGLGFSLEEMESHVDDGLPRKPPTLDQFKQQVKTRHVNLICLYRLP
ncbi:hypothetical protein NDU88_007292 [Pleurodeles waltl]|uniref:Uncharacterized protein n=1 Tax=Pleurodeles waltl TaxID=8319 RepID=A0AAV7PPG6_PLEWA|nr:hypothetical protein NDU88_007292 [Pleurodeles waltl]